MRIPQPFNELIMYVDGILRSHGPGSYDLFSRLRIAVTPAELQLLRDYCKYEGHENFIWALRAVPLILDNDPINPLYQMEHLNGKSSRPPV